MEWLLLIVVLIVLVLLLSGGSSKVVPTWREVHVERDESSVRYRDQGGQLKSETDACNGCIVNRAEQLQREGYVVEEVQIGRRNSGQL